jgi:hypothetical protein
MDNSENTKSKGGKILGWMLVLSGLATGTWWYFHLPTAGYGGLALALGATLMPLVWEKVGVICKMAWIAMLFLLFAVEYRAIDEDKRQSARELTTDFGGVSKQANDNLKNILDDEHLSFADVLKAQQDAFATTMRTIVSAQHEDERKFSALLKQQRGLFDRQQEMIESFNGHLVPGDQPMPPLASLGCMNDWVPNDAYLIRIGEMTQVVEEFPVTPLAVDIGVKGTIFATTHDLARISKRADGVLVLALDLRDKDGVIIVKLNADGIEVGPQFHALHPDKSTLVIEDSHGKEVLRIVYVMKRYLWLRTQMIVNGETIADTTMFQHYCMPPISGGGVRIFKPSS